MLEMLFRQILKDDQDQTSVTFRNLNVESNIRLLNFQDIGHVRVIDSYFSNIDTLDILHSTKCYTSMDSYTQVTCSKGQLFFAKQYDTTRWVLSNTVCLSLAKCAELAFILKNVSPSNHQPNQP